MITEHDVRERLSEAQRLLRDALLNWNSGRSSGTADCCECLETAVRTVAGIRDQIMSLDVHPQPLIQERLRALREQIAHCIRAIEATGAFWHGMTVAIGIDVPEAKRHGVVEVDA